MSLSDLASIATLISGIAVLMSLFNMSRQLRQADKNQRAIINQGAINRAASTCQFLATAEIAELSSRALEEETDFTARELSQLQMILRNELLGAQDNYVQYKAGLTDQITRDNALSVTRFLLAAPVFRALWTSSRAYYAPEWRGYVDAMIKETRPSAGINLSSQFKADFADVMH